jgi:hypothetical protein
MSERAPLAADSDHEPSPDVLDDEHLAELAREVVRRQERHREGGVESALAAPDPGPAARDADPEPA